MPFFLQRKISLAILLIALSNITYSQSLDLSFDSDGWALGGLSKSTSHSVWDTDIQSDDKIISFIQRSVNGTDIIRYNVNGSVDATFNTIQTAPGNEARAIKVDSNDKFYVAYRTGFPQSQILRYNSDGTLDASFSSLTTNFTVYRLEIDANGLVLAVGAMNADAVIARITNTGSFDLTFGTGGSKILGSGWARDVVEDASSNLFILFNEFPNTKVAKLTPSGVLDPSFGSSGIGTYNNTTELSCLDIHMVLGGFVCIGNYSTGGVTSPGSFKVMSNGSLDPSYGSGGYANLAISGFVPVNTQISVLSGGNNISVVYKGGTLTIKQVGVLMIQPDGSLNPAFGSTTAGSEIFTFSDDISPESLNTDNQKRLIINSSATNSSSMKDILLARIDLPAVFNTPLASVGIFGSLHIQSFFQLTPLVSAPGCSTSSEHCRIYFDKNLQKLLVCNNSGWQPLH